MKKSKKLLSVLLAITLIFGSISVGVSAAYAPYLNDALVDGDNYNTIDQVTLTEAQQASLLLDKVDRALADAAISIDIPLIGTLNMTSVDNALNSIYNVTGNWLFGSATVGDLVVLETYRADIASVRRTTADKTDADVLASVVTYLGHCADTLSKIIDGTFNWKIVKGFLPAEIRLLLDDIPGYLKEMLWNLIHPTTTEPMPAGTTLDTIVQYVLDNQVGGKNAAALGFDGILPGFDLNLATANGYRTIEEIAYAAMNTLLIPLLNSGLKSVIRNAVVTNAQKGGHLEDLINPDYVITEYNYDRTQGFTDQINAILGHAVNAMLKPGQTLFTWRMTANAGETQADLVKDNITKLIKVIIPLGGDTIDVSTLNTTEKLATYIARSAVKEFVKHMEVPENATLRQIAVIGMKEFIASIVPDATYTVTNTDSNEAILECAKIIGTFYFNNLFDFNYHPAAADDTFDNFLAHLLSWAMNYADGIVAIPKDGITAANVWDKLDTIVFAIADKRWFNYEEMFRDASGAGTESDLTVKTLVNYVLNTILNVDFNQLFTFFEHSTNSSLNTATAKSVLIKLVTNIVNGVVPGTIPTTGIVNFEDALDTAKLKAACKTLLEGLSAKQATLLPTVLNLVTAFMGSANEQSLGKANLTIASRIDCTSGSVPAGTKIRVSNLTTGVNRAYRDASGTLHQDAMYKIQPIELTNTANLTATVPTTAIDANGFVDVAVSGSVAENTEVRFDLKYNILDETGAVLNDTPLYTSAYAQLFKTAGNYEAMSGDSNAVHKTQVLSFPSYLYVTDIDRAAIFSVTVRHDYAFLGSDNGSQRIMRSYVTGTMPSYLAANVPTDGEPLFTLEGVDINRPSYGTANPYLINRSADDPQPYGVYPMQISFDIKNESGSTDATNPQDHTLVVYNDYGLPGLLSTIDSADRQRADYTADATAEWNAYQNILMQAYALTQGNPDHAKMFDDIVAGDVTYDNAYEKMVADVNAAVAALDAKQAATNADDIAALKAVLVAQENPEGGYFDFVNYKLFTFRRWQSWFNHAWSIVNSQENVPEGKTAPAVRALDIKYAKHMVELLYPRMIEKAAVKTALNAAITEFGQETQAGKAPDTWADYAAAKAFALEVQADATANQAKVNTARVELMKAHRNLKNEVLTPVSGSTTIIDSRQMFIYGLAPELFDLEGYASPVGSYALDYELHDQLYIGTGAYVYVMDGTSQKALYTVVLYGDLNGDGEITADDQTIMNGLVDGTGDTTGFFAGGPFFTAADLNGDGKIDALDKGILDAHIAGTATIDQRGPGYAG
ncbi:MAG: dockerin type I repeat-containing protein [Candidatus Fimivicinus sp.]|nr:dockerin type I repeat-containing protein [Oscillospiraceae bacterium]MDY5591322.1 dockerin type I repeat-containing protein [Candidatus Fimivicinus sp.]